MTVVEVAIVVAQIEIRMINTDIPMLKQSKKSLTLNSGDCSSSNDGYSSLCTGKGGIQNWFLFDCSWTAITSERSAGSGGCGPAGLLIAHRRQRSDARPLIWNLTRVETRFGLNRPAVDMERNGEIDFWGIFWDFWRNS